MVIYQPKNGINEITYLTFVRTPVSCDTGAPYWGVLQNKGVQCPDTLVWALHAFLKCFKC